MALPLLMGLLCAVADIGRAAYLGMEADVAAQAACRYAAQRVAQGDKGGRGVGSFRRRSSSLPGLRARAFPARSRSTARPCGREIERKTFDSAGGLLPKDGRSCSATGR